MTAILVRLELTNGVAITTESPGAGKQRQTISESRFKAELFLTPAGDPELSKVGYVRLNIDATPTEMPAMNQEETRVWLCEVLRKMLADD